MDDIKIEVENTFYQQGTFVMGQQSFNQFGENFEQQFEQQIETAVESAVMQSMGSILVALGSELLGSGGDMDAFEQRMENMGAQIEKKVELHARSIFLRGFLLMNNNELPVHLSSYKEVHLKFEKWCNANKISKLETCLNYVKSNKEINKIIVNS